MKDPFENAIHDFGDMKIKKHLTPEEEKETEEKWNAMTLTKKEKQKLNKELIKDIQNGTLPGYIDENGEPQILR